MAEPEHIFTIGSIIVVTPPLGDNIEAEVMAFDPKTKLLAMKRNSAGSKQSQIDIITINVDKVKNIDIKSEPEPDTQPPAVPQVESRAIFKKLERRVMERRRLAEAVNPDVCMDARRLFHKAGKLFDPDLKTDVNAEAATRWSAKNEIIVMDSIAIIPPYLPDCVVPYCTKSNKVLESNQPGTKVDFVKKMVMKYYDEQELCFKQPKMKQDLK